MDKEYESEINKIIAKNICRYLDEIQKSQLDLANYLKISPAAVSYWCTGQKMPRMDKIDAICKYLNVSRSDLMTDHNAIHFDENKIVFHSVNLEERDLILAYRRADDATKQIIRKILDMDPPAEKRNESIS